MSQTLAVVLSDGTSLRAGVTFKQGLPVGLAHGAPARLPRPGGAGFSLAIGSPRQIAQVGQTDWAFLTDRAGRLPLDQLRGSRSGALFLNFGGNPRSEIESFLRRLELVEADSSGLVRSFKIADNGSPPPTGRLPAPGPRSTPGSHIAPSQTKVIVMGRSQPRDTSTGGQTWTVFNAYTVKYPAPVPGSSGGRAMPSDRIPVSFSYFNNVPTGGGAAPAEEITLTFTEIKWTPQSG